MSASEAIHETVEQEGSDPRLRLHFRVLALKDGRKGFRLEMIFWEVLEVLARRNGRTLAEEVDVRLRQAPGHLNQSSALRAGMAGDLLDQWSATVAKVVRPQWAGIVAAMPTPAFAASRRSMLLSVNEALLTYLQGRIGRRTVAPLNTVQGAADLSLEALPGVTEKLAGEGERRFVACSVAFKAGAQRIVCRARLMPLEGAALDTPVLLGFIDPDFD